MKHLSIKEKAKAYDELIKKLRDFYRDYDTISHLIDVKEELANIIPELKESENEDEKIRKSIVSGMKALQEKGKYTCFANVPMDDVFAWLEKQGNKDKLIKELGEYKVKYTQEVLEKHINKDDERLRKTTIAFLKDFADKGYENAVECIDWLKKQGDLTIRFFTDEFEWALGRIVAFWNQNHKDGKYDENELMSYIKVRETELVKLFTDNVCKVSLSDCSEEYRKAYYDGYNKCNRDWLKIKDISVDKYNKKAEILLSGQGEQKPTDEEMKELLRTEYEKGRADAIAEMQVAWSEEDETKLRQVEYACMKFYGGDCSHIDWLRKATRPQNQWKPSDEQMASITCAMRKMKESACYDSELVSLFNDLNKLMEK